MKKLLILAFTSLLTVAAWAQPTVTLLTFESYTFADKFDTEYGSGKIQDGFQWGAGLEFGLSDEMAVELIYQNLQTDAYYQGFDGRYDGTIGINYAMLGGTRYAPLNDKISGFGTIDLGAAWSSPSESLDSKSVTKFAVGGRLGVRIQTSEKVSLRLHAQLLSPVQWAGGGFYFGTGGGGAGVSTGSTIWQFNLGGSLNFRLR
ncbi:MAG: porin family protein [Cyclobacteriaceae bacterium]|nr:porin family protein [Cyclobacteriaceae bacterium]